MPISRQDEVFLRMAKTQGARSTLKSVKRGAILAKNNKVLSVGISTHLGEGIIHPQTLIQEERYIATIKAELQCISNAIKAGINITGATMYISEAPDWYTFKLIATMGVKRVLFYGQLTNKRTQHYAQLMGIQLLPVG